MNFLSRNKLLSLVIIYLVVVLVAIPLTLVNLRKPHETRTQAAGAASLSFNPANVTTTTGQPVAMDVMVDPGQHSVSFVTLDISYDPTKLSLDQNAANSFQVNTTAFPQLLEGPVFESGRVRAKVSIGYDPTKAITTPTKVATLNFTAVGPTNGQEPVVNFGISSYVLSVAANDSATDNVLGTVTPELATITGNPTGNVGNPVTPVPTFTAPTATPPITLVQPTDVVQPTIPAGPTCTPLPDICTVDDTQPICTQIPAGGYCTGAPLPTPTPNGLPTPTPIACQKVQPADVMLVLDTSGSMHGDKAGNAAQSAKSFVNLLKNDATNEFGVVTFSKTAQVVSGLTQDANTVNNAIDNIKLGGSTCISCGLQAADQALSSGGRPDAKKIMILLTDGKANAGGTGGKDAAEQAAVNALQNAQTQPVTVYTIGIGNDVNPAFLQQLSTMSQGAYYFATSAVNIDDQFQSVYKTISNAVCQPGNNPGGNNPGGNNNGGQVNPTLPIGQNTGNIDPVTIIMVILLFLPLLLLIGHLLV